MKLSGYKVNIQMPVALYIPAMVKWNLKFKNIRSPRNEILLYKSNRMYDLYERNYKTIIKEIKGKIK